MATQHICGVDCNPEPIVWRDAEGKEHPGTAHVMYAAEPSSAAGRYQWEQNRAILDQGRRAWRASGQGQSRACRVWDENRRQILSHLSLPGWPMVALLRERSMHRLEVGLFG